MSAEQILAKPVCEQESVIDLSKRRTVMIVFLRHLG